jgi:hypothetical protein
MTDLSETFTDHDRAELQAFRDGAGQLAEDPMHAGQPVIETFDWHEGEPSYWLQITHAGVSLWSCQACMKVTIGAEEPDACVGCGAADMLAPLLYDQRATCRSWSKGHGGQYDGECLIAGSDGCECSGI